MPAAVRCGFTADSADSHPRNPRTRSVAPSSLIKTRLGGGARRAPRAVTVSRCYLTAPFLGLLSAPSSWRRLRPSFWTTRLPELSAPPGWVRRRHPSKMALHVSHHAWVSDTLRNGTRDMATSSDSYPVFCSANLAATTTTARPTSAYPTSFGSDGNEKLPPSPRSSCVRGQDTAQHIVIRARVSTVRKPPAASVTAA